MRLITLGVLSVSVLALRADRPEATRHAQAKRRRRDNAVIETPITTELPTTEAPITSSADAVPTTSTLIPTGAASSTAPTVQNDTSVGRDRFSAVALFVLALNPQASFADVQRAVPAHINQELLQAAYQSEVREISKPLWFHDDVQMLIRQGFDRPNAEHIGHFAGHLGPITGFMETPPQFEALISNWMMYCNSTKVAAIPEGVSAPYVQRGPVVMLEDAYAANYVRQRLNGVNARLGRTAVAVPPVLPRRTPPVDTTDLRNIEAIVLSFLAEDMFVTDKTIVARATAQGIATTAVEVERIRLGFLWWTAQPSWFHSLVESANELGLTDEAFPLLVQEIVSRAPTGSEYADSQLAESVASLWYRFCFANGPVCFSRAGGKVMPVAVAQQVFAEFLAGFADLALRPPITELVAAELLLRLHPSHAMTSHT